MFFQLKIFLGALNLRFQMKISVRNLIFIQFQILFVVKSEMIFHATSLGCTASGKTISDSKCFIKAYSKDMQTYNGYMNITRSVYNCKVRNKFFLIWSFNC